MVGSAQGIIEPGSRRSSAPVVSANDTKIIAVSRDDFIIIALFYAKIVQGERRVSQACLSCYAKPQPILCKDSANQEQNNKVPSECFAKMPPKNIFLSVEHFLKTIHIFAFRSPHCAHIASYPSHLII